MASNGIISYHSAAVETVLKQHPADGHSGLMFDRFLALRERGGGGIAKPLREPLQEFVCAFNKGSDPNRHRLLLEHHKRLQTTYPLYATQQWDLKVQWRLTTGLGQPHPTENGFSFHELIGVPYLAGAAVKGLCRQAAKVLDGDTAGIEALLGPEAEDGQRVTSETARSMRIEALLGPEAEEAHRACGDLVFYDALPTEWPKLVVDVVNSHHSQYYSGQRDEKHRSSARATETESPIPVFFLAVSEPSCFRFCIGSRSKSSRHIEQGSKWLHDGLGLLGIGAKTAVGYGVMEPVTKDKSIHQS